MTPAEQQQVIEFLKEILPNEYYAVANGDYVEVHKIDIDDSNLQISIDFIPFRL